jgi:hypothetical protein
MTAQDWGILIPAVATFLISASAWLKSHQAQKTAKTAVKVARTR